MATKEQPGAFDCYTKALKHEPLFTLLGRDPNAPELIRSWAKMRAKEIGEGKRPPSDIEQIAEALDCADAMVQWRARNEGAWRNTPLAMAAEQTGEG